MGRRTIIAAVAVGLFALAGCSSTQAASELGAPLSVIPASDSAVETNVNTLLQSAQGALAASGSFAGFDGTAASVATTTGASTGPALVSYALVAGGDGLLAVAWNHADRHCVGALDVHSSLPSAVLGETAAAQYDFVAPAVSPSECTASAFDTPAAPSDWPQAPSASGWKP